MQVVKDSLPEGGDAAHMHILTGQPISSCQKMLCGVRSENMETLQSLLGGKNLDLAVDVLCAFVGEDAPLAKAARLQEDLRRAKQVIKTLQARIAE
jgi:hypothetical protein